MAENVVMLLLNQQNVQLVDPHFRMGIITADPDTPFPQLNLVTLDEFMQTRLVKEQ